MGFEFAPHRQWDIRSKKASDAERFLSCHSEDELSAPNSFPNTLKKTVEHQLRLYSPIQITAVIIMIRTIRLTAKKRGLNGTYSFKRTIFHDTANF